MNPFELKVGDQKLFCTKKCGESETAGIQVDIRITTSDITTYLHMLILISIRTTLL